MAAGGTHESTSVIVLTAEPRTPVGLTHRLKLMLGPTGWIATAFHDPHLAFAELCLRERAQASRAAWGLQRVEKLSMVIVDPTRWPAMNDLVAAIKRYSPSVAVWSYRDGHLQAVAAPAAQASSPADHAMTVMDAEDEPADVPAVEPTARFASTHRTPLRLAGADEGDDEQFVPASSDSAPDAPNGHGAGAAAANSTTVTREEIDLLLKRSTDAPSNSSGDGSDRSTGIPA